MSEETLAHLKARMTINAYDNAYVLRRQLVSSMLDPRRDMDAECGYLPNIGPENYRQMFDREGIATRVVSMMPNDCWELPPEIKEKEGAGEETPWEKDFNEKARKYHFWHYLQRLDVMSGIGHYGVLLIGLNDNLDLSLPAAGLNDDGTPTAERPKGAEIIYLKPFDESLVYVNLWESDLNNPRYGQPVQYRIQFFDPRTERPEGTGLAISSHTVHWTRIVHAADDRLSSEVFGTPRQKPVFNYLCNIRKILGGSAEMFWKGGFPGLAFEVDPTIGDTTVELDPEALRGQMEAYANGLSRYLAVAGVQVKSLAPQIADPTPSLKAQLQAISISKDIPINKLIGSEKSGMGGKNEDETETWNKKLNRRQTHYITPMIVRPFVQRLMDLGIQDPLDDFKIIWPDLNTTDDGAVADVCLKMTQAMQAYVAGDVSTLIHPAEWFKMFAKLSEDQIEAIAKGVQEFVGIEENRNMEKGLTPEGKQPPPPPGNVGMKPNMGNVTPKPATKPPGK